MIKYIGSKRRLVPILGDLLERAGAASAADLFTGTTRVAQEWKRRGARVTAVDSARCASTLADCYIATDAAGIDRVALRRAIDELQALPGRDGYVTETFSRAARYFQEANARRIDAIRDAIEARWGDHPWRPLLLTSLLRAADQVDSTTGVQMAYLKRWAPRSYRPLALEVPVLLEGPGTSIRADVTAVVRELPDVDLAYLDPPYNQHRYGSNYHVWETLIAWDAPDHYGVACKRVDVRDPATASVFNRRREAPAALAELVAGVRAEVVVVSGSDESWIPVADLADMAGAHGAVEVLAFDSARYVGARIGIHDPGGRKVGTVGRTRNIEYLVVAGPPRTIARMCDGYR